MQVIRVIPQDLNLQWFMIPDHFFQTSRMVRTMLPESEALEIFSANEFRSIGDGHMQSSPSGDSSFPLPERLSWFRIVLFGLTFPHVLGFLGFLGFLLNFRPIGGECA